MGRTNVATGNDTGLPDGTGMEIFEFADGGLGGYSAIVDPANPTRALTPAADGSLPVTVQSSALPSGAATSAKQDTGNTSVASIDTKTPSLGQALAGASTPVVLTAAEEAQLGAVNEPAPATDTASAGLNGRLQRIAQRLTSLLALLPSSLGAGGGLKVDGSGTALPVSATSLPLPTGAATEATLDARTGSLTETAPATDTASSGLNGRLQRVAQRLTSLIALFPSALDAASAFKVGLTSIAGNAVSAGNGVSGTGVQRVTLASDSTGQVAITSAAVTAKGTQGSNGGVPVQPLCDAGRSLVVLVIDTYQSAANTETLVNTMQSIVNSGTPTTGLSSYQVTTGKKFRIVSISGAISITTGNTTAITGIVRIRTNAGAAATVTSPVLMQIANPGQATPPSYTAITSPALGGDFELNSGDGIGVTWLLPDYTVTTKAPRLHLTIIGWEY